MISDRKTPKASSDGQKKLKFGNLEYDEFSVVRAIKMRSKDKNSN